MRKRYSFDYLTRYTAIVVTFLKLTLHSTTQKMTSVTLLLLAVCLMVIGFVYCRAGVRLSNEIHVAVDESLEMALTFEISKDR